ncbi:MAG: hypothetical protein EOO20_01795 [Chryseobacterium sp.]|nr:MAG: hypothetical protein EOO20_01795 [Chryseobacterium sp.]
MKKEEIVLAMSENEEFSKEYLDHISQEDIDKPSEKLENHEDFGVRQTWTGNNFYMSADKKRWFWEDTPGSQCGRTRKWEYGVNNGDTVRVGGNCQQGYQWFQMELNI